VNVAFPFSMMFAASHTFAGVSAPGGASTLRL
jgi:hypothetical protein